VPYRLTPVQQRYVYYHPRMQWADPDVQQAAERLRWVREHREEASRKAAEAATSLNHRYAPAEIGLMMRGRLVELLRKTNPPRYQRLRLAESRERLHPPVPVPGAWYDADYFEHGIKSNWAGGYSWNGFQRLFRDAAAFFVEMLPLANSFLDAGCAKGFLVKALRGAGKEAWGFDASSWAIEQAEPEARPFVRLASVDDFVFEQPVDVLACFDLLPHLTEEQAAAFLRRARSYVRIAAVAVIATYANPADTDPSDRDHSRVTRQTREWWDGVFRAAGWRQDGFGRNFERLCQQHELPRRIGWTMYVYAPE